MFLGELLQDLRCLSLVCFLIAGQIRCRLLYTLHMVLHTFSFVNLIIVVEVGLTLILIFAFSLLFLSVQVIAFASNSFPLNSKGILCIIEQLLMYN
nr:MAG TPA: hypothetical protein [Caudoviricetes sp.]